MDFIEAQLVRGEEENRLAKAVLEYSEEQSFASYVLKKNRPSSNFVIEGFRPINPITTKGGPTMNRFCSIFSQLLQLFYRVES